MLVEGTDSSLSNVLPNFPLLVRLLGFANRLPASHIAIKDLTTGFEASHIRLLNDVLSLRASIFESLNQTSQERLVKGEEVFVLVLASPGYDYAVSFLATLAVGAVIVPVSPHVPLQEALYFAEKSTATGIVYQPKFAKVAAAIRERMNSTSHASFATVETTPSLGRLNLASNQIYIHPNRSLNPQQPGLVIFTSGTTGRPKAVLLPREILSSGAQALADHFELSHQDVALHCMPVHHIAGISVCFVPFLLTGARLEFEPFRVDRVWERLRNGGITVFGGVPTMYARLMRHYEDHIRPSPEGDSYVQGLRQLRFLMSGTSALPAPLRAKWTLLTGGKRILERYGASEFSTAILTPLQSLEVPDGSVGVSLSGCDVKLASQPEGEILVKCPGMLLRYHGDTDATRAAFNEQGYFKTGDIGRQEGDYWFILGRASMDIIKSGGYKISSLDIEREILGLDYISEVSVMGVADEEFGQRVAAVIVLRDTSSSLSLTKLRNDLRASLSGYKLPTLLFVIDSIEKTASGKVQKIQLRKEVFDSGKYESKIQRFVAPAVQMRPRL